MRGFGTEQRMAIFNHPSLSEPLTQRELEILKLLTEGYSNGEIAQALFLTLGTVKWYNRRIFEKLDVTKRTEAVARVHELGLLREDEENIVNTPVIALH